MNQQPDTPVIIKLDDPTPRAAWVVVVLAVIAVVILVAAPLLILEPEPDTAENRAPVAPASRQVCKPLIDTPDFLIPVTTIVLPGFMRVCDWFAPPEWPPAGSSSRVKNVIEP